jgi:hypothetical protein
LDAKQIIIVLERRESHPRELSTSECARKGKQTSYTNWAASIHISGFRLNFDLYTSQKLIS